MSATTDSGVVAWTFPVDTTLTLAGQPLVKLTVQTPAPDAEVAARLWDLSPDGKQTLMSRGVYRLAGMPAAPSGPIAFQLSSNAWRVPAGDKLKLEVSGADTPYFQVDSIPSLTQVSAASLELPVVEGPPTQVAAAATAAPAPAAPAPAAGSPGGLPATGGDGARTSVICAALLLGAAGLRRLRRRF
jgi:predicted acyl esterase